MIQRLLIANRGEIACRIIRTARKLGIECLSIYAPIEERAQHVLHADRAYCIDVGNPRETYLDQDALINIARHANADAIHPGYGFLAENADFARRCRENGVIFVGPAADTIDALGRKDQARKLAIAADVPVIPGYDGAEQTISDLRQAASGIEYPVLLKPSAGGGGKGMRIVRDPSNLAEAIESARREAQSAFGDDHLVIERYLDWSRHIEVQVFGDRQGNLIHLYERDCSLQRRHQKIIEEAPAAGLNPSTRQAMLDAAVRLAKEVNYVGAGTVEFLLDRDDSFYFIEMNTRLQVEHPVTEVITGEDLVAWQLKTASGQSIPCRQSEVPCNGHAIEARLYAEDPSNNFLPSTGQIDILRWPVDQTRIDSGLVEGDAVTPYFDPMLAKQIVHGRTRAEATLALFNALSQTRIYGIKTNLDFLATITRSREFESAAIDTAWLDKVDNVNIAGDWALPIPPETVAATAMVLNQQNARITPEFHGWRLNAASCHQINFELARNIIRQEIREQNGLYCTNGGFSYAAQLDGTDLSIANDGHCWRCAVFVDDFAVRLAAPGYYRRFPFAITNSDTPQGNIDPGKMTAPMPGKVTSVQIKVGDQVEAGTTLAVLEAMKMEHRFKALVAGTVQAVHVQPGDQIDEGALILDLEPADTSA